MGWGRGFIIGGLGQSSSSEDHVQDLRRLRGSMNSTREVERNQDANIDALWTENHELKIYLRALIHLLVSNRLLTSEEIGQMVRTIERSAEPDARPPLDSPGGVSDTSKELQELQHAVDENRRNQAGGESV